jgi:hypothetical protein
MEADKIASAIERLTQEKQRRIDEKFEKGEVVRVSLTVVAECQEAAAIEDAKAQRLAELREAGEQREVVFDTTPNSHRRASQSWPGKWERSADLPAPLPELPGLSPSTAADIATEPRYICIQLRQPTQCEPGGAISEAHTVARGAVYVGEESDVVGRSKGVRPPVSVGVAFGRHVGDHS